eukprot:TRINITY_DN50657_c0_g1_i1.p1 TRINITY_DN50657_c0_g1~~TRINITY_DN50657_c0_g1_i1.p1  ORF type:complete len:427 (+),score=84.52 TRINITY_DN50657_c0_g1_i1:100-1281(+)
MYIRVRFNQQMLSLLMLVFGGFPATATLDPSALSAIYRNWTYVNGSYDGFVVPPLAGGFKGQSLTDTAVVFEAAPEDQSSRSKWRMTYLFFNNTPGGYGYETAMASSDDLLEWRFGEAGDHGIVFHRSAVPGAYDYGGVTFGGIHFNSSGLRAKRVLQKAGGRYHALYGCYPSRDGYEAGNGGQGMAESEDGAVWSRVSATVPALSGGSSKLAPWEDRVVYQPFLLQTDDGNYWDFYNAAGTNSFGNPAEESGIANLPRGSFPGIGLNRSEWVRNPASPVLPSGPAGSPDTAMASDPKVFWDEVQKVWVMFYFGLGDSTHGHADILIAFSTDLLHWEKDTTPLYEAGGHPMGIDSQHAHKISIVYEDDVGYLFYTAVGPKGRGIALLTSKPLQ